MTFHAKSKTRDEGNKLPLLIATTAINKEQISTGAEAIVRKLGCTYDPGTYVGSTPKNVMLTPM
jgi:hypothetical protein